MIFRSAGALLFVWSMMACGTGATPEAVPAADSSRVVEFPDQRPDGVVPAGMLWIPGGEFTMGTNDSSAYPEERPAHRVRVHGYWMDTTEVTNTQFEEFTKATGYLTDAEKKPLLEDIMANTAPGTPEFKGAPILLALVAGIAIGLGIPHKLVSMQINKRIKMFNTKFPDAIDLMVRGLRSGLPISETLGIVSSEIPDPVGSEFRSVSDRIRIGKTMEAALDECAERIGTPEFQFFCITLAIQRETGGNLAETLSNLSEVLRKRAQMKLKIKAMSSESKASAYIIGALPFLVFGIIYFVNSAYMGQFFTDQRLIVAGLGGMCWMGIGAFIMAQMINFEI